MPSNTVGRLAPPLSTIEGVRSHDQSDASLPLSFYKTSYAYLMSTQPNRGASSANPVGPVTRRPNNIVIAGSNQSSKPDFTL